MSKIATRYDITGCTSASDILTKCGLDWEPELRKIESSYMAENFRAVVNPISNKALAFTGERFRPNSHMKVVNDMEVLMLHGSITPHSVSVWDGGGKIALQYRCPDRGGR